MLNELLYPKSIAIVGASRFPRKIGYEVLFNLLEGKFKGQIIPINPSAKEILGLKCYVDLQEYGNGVDLCVVTVPAESVPNALQRAIEGGARSFCIIGAGFKEAGGEGILLEQQIRKICTDAHIRMLGPNCLGIINTHNDMNATFARPMPVRGKISVISQSGGLCTAILDFAAIKKMGLSMLVSMGNKADIDESDLLQALAEDENTEVIVGYLEDIENGARFIEVAQRATKMKPIIILKAGTTEEGMRAAASHTGSMVGVEAVYEAAFRKTGVITANNFEEIFDFAIAFATQHLPDGRRIAVVSNSGGPAVMAIDAVVRMGLQPARFSERTIATLKKILPSSATPQNPLDMIGDATVERFKTVIQTVAEDEGVDALAVIFLPQAITSAAEVADVLTVLGKMRKPLLASFVGGRDADEGRKRLIDASIPEYPTPERVIATFRQMCDYKLWKEQKTSLPADIRGDVVSAQQMIHKAIANHINKLSEVDAKKVLRVYGFKIPDGRLAYSSSEAVKIASELGFPVVVKVISPDIFHKTDVGGVILDLTDENAVECACRTILSTFSKKMPHARFDGFYVEKMIPEGLELILGMKRDSVFGPVLMFGLGGIYTETFEDVAFAVNPSTEQEVMDMISSTKCYRILQGVRGHCGYNLDRLVQCILMLSQLVRKIEEITEIDINPLTICKPDDEPIVVDAKIVLKSNS